MMLFLLAAKALVENECCILQLTTESLNDLHQKTKTVQGPKKAYKTEEKQQKLLAAEEGGSWRI